MKPQVTKFEVKYDVRSPCFKNSSNPTVRDEANLHGITNKLKRSQMISKIHHKRNAVRPDRQRWAAWGSAVLEARSAASAGSCCLEQLNCSTQGLVLIISHLSLLENVIKQKADKLVLYYFKCLIRFYQRWQIKQMHLLHFKKCIYCISKRHITYKNKEIRRGKNTIKLLEA